MAAIQLITARGGQSKCVDRILASNIIIVASFSGRYTDNSRLLRLIRRVVGVDEERRWDIKEDAPVLKCGLPSFDSVSTPKAPKMYFKGTVLAFAALALMVNAAPTDTALVVRSPSEATTSSLDVRSTGDVQMWSDAASLEKRISLGLYTVNLAALGAFTQQACTPLFTLPPNALTGTVCAASAFATLAYVIASHWIVTGRSVARDLTIDGPSGSLAFHFNHLPGHTATHSMAAAYALSNSTDPILVASHTCSGRGCYNYHYLNYEHPRIGTVHKVSQSPRGDWATGLSRKRQEYTDQDAYEDSYDETDGTPIYGTYFYWDVTPSDENMLGNDNSGDAIAEALFDSATQTSAFDNQGYYCVDIVDSGNGGAVPSTGYFDVSEGENMDDPDNEQSYLEMCYDDEFGKRAVRKRASVVQ